MHTTTGRWRLGLGLALVTAVMWGLLPIALKILLGGMDAYSIAWYRFLVSAVLLGGYLAARRGLPRIGRLGKVGLCLLIVATLGLAGNYLMYQLGLETVTPGTAQTVVQLAPLFLMLGGLVVFRETFSGKQWIGLVVLLAGMLLFFNRRVSALVQSWDGETIGVVLVVGSAVSWTAYALVQKQLLLSMRSADTMWLIYVGSAVLFLPTASPGSLIRLSGFHLGLLLFASVNTLVAYGAFAEALEHWEASKVGAVLALVPLLTLVFMAACAAVWPEITPSERFTTWTVAGAVLVVIGSALCALGRQAR